ncbi:hypothetical protein ACFE04_030338 [Oxalis oulophora]
MDLVMRFMYGGVVSVLLMVSSIQLRCVNGKSNNKVPCFFIFGDSLVDSGNNNNLQTVAKVNYKPYGIDFPPGPTGRFTNGRTAVDFLARMLGIHDYIQPFSTADDHQVLDGVNYASGSSGILDITGQQTGDHVSLNQQLQNHKSVISRIIKVIGNKRKAEHRLRKCLYSVGMGSNDYINNYFVPSYYNSSKLYGPRQFADALIKQYALQLKTLYNYGARKIVVNGIGEIGCVPFVRSVSGDPSKCVKSMNDAAKLFNKRVVWLTRQLQKNFSDVKFLYIDNASPFLTFPGFVEDVSCCKVNSFGLCDPKEPMCTSRNTHRFWDGFHPTEIVHKRAAWITFANAIAAKLI